MELIVAKKAIIRIYNKSKQLIPIQVRPPKSDFYPNEQQVRLEPGKDVTLPRSHVRMDQIENLQKRGMLQITFDNEA